MMRLRDVLGDLQESDAMLDLLQGRAEANPDDRVLAANLSAVVKRRRDLERRLGGLLSRDQYDHVRYTLAREGSAGFPAGAVARSVALFQDMLTAVYAGVRDGAGAAPSAEVEAESALVLSTPWIGAPSMSFTIPNERLLAIESTLDSAFEAMFAVLRADTATRIRQLAKEVGVRAVAAVHAWAAHAASAGFDVSIAWRKNNDAVRSAAVGRDDARQLATIIAEAAEETTEETEREGELVALDITAGTFRLLAEGAEIAGRLDDDFPRDAKATVRARYRAVLARVTRLDYATAGSSVRWFLRRLVAVE